MQRKSSRGRCAIGQAAALDYAGGREGARSSLAALWRQIHPHGDALHRCTLADYMADMQDDPYEELLWDQRALEARERLRQYDPQGHRTPGRPA